MKIILKFFLISLLFATLVSCSQLVTVGKKIQKTITSSRPSQASAELPPATKRYLGLRYKIGSPYKIKGKWYHPKENFSHVEVGVASWYGPNFHGKKTANGAIFDQNSMTAAHRTLPLPSWVKVTNLDNGKFAYFLVNDRGPFAHNRVIDLSKKGAEVLGFRSKGITNVRIEILASESKDLRTYMNTGGKQGSADLARNKATYTPKGRPQEEVIEAEVPTTVTETSDKTDVTTALQKYDIQVGAFKNKKSAINLANRLKDFASSRIETTKVNEITLYRVKLGPFISEEEANQLGKYIAQNFNVNFTTILRK